MGICRIMDLEEKLKTFELSNDELQKKNADITLELTDLKTKKRPDEHSILNVEEKSKLEQKISELTRELDDSNKLTIRLKLEHKKKLQQANKTIEQLKSVRYICFVFAVIGILKTKILFSF